MRIRINSNLLDSCFDCIMYPCKIPLPDLEGQHSSKAVHYFSLPIYFLPFELTYLSLLGNVLRDGHRSCIQN